MIEKLIQQMSQDTLWNKWMAANSATKAGCISANKEGCISGAKEGCISIAPAKAMPKAGCIS